MVRINIGQAVLIIVTVQRCDTVANTTPRSVFISPGVGATCPLRLDCPVKWI